MLIFRKHKQPQPVKPAEKVTKPVEQVIENSWAVTESTPLTRVYARCSVSKNWFMVVTDSEGQVTKFPLRENTDKQVAFRGMIAEVYLTGAVKVHLERPEVKFTESMSLPVTDEAKQAEFIIMQGNGIWLAPKGHKEVVTDRNIMRLRKVK